MQQRMEKYDKHGTDLAFMSSTSGCLASKHHKLAFT